MGISTIILQLNIQMQKTPISIICKEHGIFNMRPANHTNQKQGCPKCGKLKQAKTQSLTTDQWIEKARLVHGDKYDYSKVTYSKSSEKVCVNLSRNMENSSRLQQNILKEKVVKSVVTLLKELKGLSNAEEFHC